jgi:hypothetical protein
MSRRPTKIEQNIPLYLIPDIVKREVRTHGEDLDWVFVRKSGSHFYNIRTRTKPVRRELRSVWARPGTRELHQGDAEDTGGGDGHGGEPEWRGTNQRHRADGDEIPPVQAHFGKKQIPAIFLPGSFNAGERIFLANLTVIFSWNGKIMQNIRRLFKLYKPPYFQWRIPDTFHHYPTIG